MDWGDVLRSVLIGVTVGLAPWLGNRIQRRKLRKQAGAGRTTVAVRTVSEQHPDLTARWQRRTAVPAPGRLELSRWLVGGWDHLALDVVAVRPGHRELMMREWLSVGDVQARVLTVRTSAGELELAVGREQVEWVRTQLSGAAVRPPGSQ